MKTPIYNKRGTKQIVNTGFKKFDNATNSISIGNCHFNTQRSSYIRTFKNVECNGQIRAEGELLKFDLSLISEQIPKSILDILYDKEREHSVILYRFFVGTDTIGYVLTTHQYLLITSVVCYSARYSDKRYNVIQECIKYITVKSTFEIPLNAKEILKNGSNPCFEQCIVNDYEYVYYHHYFCKKTITLQPYSKPFIEVYKLLGISKLTGCKIRDHIAVVDCSNSTFFNIS